MPTPIAVDCGHGYTKALAVNGASAIFPSLICPTPSTLDLGEFGQTKPIQIDGQPYLVGEAARKHAAPLWSRDKATDPDTLRLILVAAAQLGAQGPVALATGLPLSWYGNQRRAFRDALVGYGGTMQQPGHPPQRLWFESAVVLPQGLTAAGSLLSQSAYEPGDYLVVDVGYRTTDYLIATKTPDGRLSYDASAAGSLALGMSAVAKTIADTLSQQHQVSFSPAEVELVSTVTVRGQRHDVTQARATAQRAVGRQIVQTLALDLGDGLDKCVGIVAVGGGADLITRLLPGAATPADPQWANVQGYWAMLT